MGTMDRLRRENLPAFLYIAAVALLGAALLVAGVVNTAAHRGIDRGLLPWGAMALLTIVAGRVALRLPLPFNCRLSFADAFIVLSLLMFGTDLATVTGALDGWFASPRGKDDLHKRLFNTGGVAISVYLASRLSTQMLHGGAGARSSPFFPLRLLMAMLILAAAQYTVNALLVSGVIALTERAPLTAVWQASFSWAATCCLAGALAAGIVSGVNQGGGPLTVVALLPFPLVIYSSYRAIVLRIQARQGAARA